VAAANRKHTRKLVAALLASTVMVLYTVGSAAMTYGQDAPTKQFNAKVPADSKLILSANQLTYDRDKELVVVSGAVQIYYGGYKMVAQRVEYNQKTHRMTAIGNVELVTPDGNRMYGDKMDVTDNFSDGFVNALRVEMPDNTRLAAEKGERVGGTQLILTKGVYTACQPCSLAGRVPLWQVKAERVVQNGETHTVRLEHAKFQLFGQSVAYVPWIEVPDNTVKRKSGFLFPTFSISQNLGFGATLPYYYVISPSMDVTISPTYYTTQGLLLQGEFRQRLENGTYNIRLAGIDQAKPSQFAAGTTDANATTRGLVASKGDFQINPRWAFGWDAMAQTDNNFARTYNLPGLNQSTHINDAYLVGVGKRNFFDMRAYYFNEQNGTNQPEAAGTTSEKQQPIVYPVIDYHYVDPKPVAGGELSATVNLTNLSRDQADVLNNTLTLGNSSLNDRFLGLPGNDTRLTTEVQWQRTYATDQGLLLTPLLAARGDGFVLGMESPQDLGDTYNGDFDDNSTATRGMLTAGLEAKYPILVSTDNSTHVFEPIAQIYARPNEQLAGGLPNEDAQSFVFDAMNLFNRDKYSGYDRVEGGTRANLGIRYTGNFDNGYKLQSIFGQSYQLAGLNSFSTPDLVGAGAESGLQNNISDYVGMFGVNTPQGIALSTSYRLAHNDLSYQRGDTSLGFSNQDFSATMIYTHIAAQPQYGFLTNQDEIQTRAQINFKENWSVFGTVSYDLNGNQVTRSGVGLTYQDECTTFTLAYLENKDTTNTSGSDWSIAARLTFRTLGDINIGAPGGTAF
jgi:LPS-assembly protein